LSVFKHICFAYFIFHFYGMCIVLVKAALWLSELRTAFTKTEVHKLECSVAEHLRRHEVVVVMLTA